MMRTRSLFATVLLLGGLCARLASAEEYPGLSIFGPESLKYKAGENRVFINPDAPITGTMHYEGAYFTKLSPFGITGRGAPGLFNVWEPLASKSWDDDEPFALYGVLAKDFELSDDKLLLTIRMREEARFADGVPVTADDVVFSYELLFDPGVNPALKLKWQKNVVSVKKVDRLTVQIHFKESRRDTPLSVLSWWSIYPKHIYGAPGKNLETDFNDMLPIGSGPWEIESYVLGQEVTYRRRDDYWAKDIRELKGTENWKRRKFEIYYDEFSKMEALKSGQLDWLANLPPDVFAQLGGKYFDRGFIKKGVFPITRPAAMFCLPFNLRRPIWQDIELRKVIISLFDFDYINKTFKYGDHDRLISYFNNQKHLRAASGPATGKVLELLTELAKKHNDPAAGIFHVRPEAFTRGPYELGTDPHGQRYPIDERIVAAATRLDELGWAYDKKAGVRIKNGVPLNLEIIHDAPETFYFCETLSRVGIKATPAKLSPLEQQGRMKSFNFDMTAGWYDGRKAPGREMARNFLSSDADVKGSANVMGLKNPAVDELFETLATSASKETVSIYAKALDRVLSSGWYVVPLTWPRSSSAVYWDYLKQPEVYCSGLWVQYNIMAHWWIDQARYDEIKRAIKEGK
ncbi:MAG: ABC transporter substrate-binding protein [Kiritimatiellia bacterium]|jgi:microcin C transport system substrate-binding protein|nr:ABC transporter substrate-binding protein [Kiritimatiellia bacterium]